MLTLPRGALGGCVAGLTETRAKVFRTLRAPSGGFHGACGGRQPQAVDAVRVHYKARKDGAGSDDGELSDEEVQAAVEVAAEIYSDAVHQAEEATRMELLDVTDWSDPSEWTDTLDKTIDDGNSITVERATTFGGDVGLKMSLTAFLTEQGMTVLQADSTAEFLVASRSPFTQKERLAAKMERLRRVLPGLDVPAAVAAEPKLLRVDLASAIERMIFLSQTLGGDVNVMEIIKRDTSLLWMEDMQGKVRNAVDTLDTVLPDGYPRDMMVERLVSEPSLIRRLAYHAGKRSFGELPVDMQNLFVEGGGGGGSLWKSWSGFTDNNTD